MAEPGDMVREVPAKARAPGRLELAVDAERGTPVGADRRVEDEVIPVVIACQIKACEARVVIITAHQPVHLALPFVGRAADGREGALVRDRVVVIHLPVAGLRRRGADLRAADGVQFAGAELTFPAQVAPQQVAEPVRPAPGHAPVALVLGFAVIAEPVAEGREGGRVDGPVGGVPGGGAGGKARKGQRWEDLPVGLGADRQRRVDGLRVVQVQFPEEGESLVRQDLLGPAAVVIAEGEPGMVAAVAAVCGPGLLVRIGEIGVGKGVDRTFGSLGHLTRGLQAEVEGQAFPRSPGQVSVEAEPLVAVVDQKALVVIVTA